MNTTQQTTTRTRKRMNLEFINLPELKTFVGKVVGNFTKKYSKGWESDFITMDLLNEEGETVTTVLDGGLRGALKMAGVITGEVIKGANPKEIVEFDLQVLKPDVLIEIEHAGKIEVADGKSNSYNIYEIN